MRTSIIQIGNSKGVRIPKIMLEELNLKKEVDIAIRHNAIFIVPIRKKSRQGWESKFKKMSKRKDDKLLINDALDNEFDYWEWK